ECSFNLSQGARILRREYDRIVDVYEHEDLPSILFGFPIKSQVVHASLESYREHVLIKLIVPLASGLLQAVECPAKLDDGAMWKSSTIRGFHIYRFRFRKLPV